jgi:hypothetical protein
VRDEVARGVLAFHPIDHDPLLTVHAIVCRSGAATTPLAGQVRRVLREVMCGLTRTGTWAGACMVATPRPEDALGPEDAPGPEMPLVSEGAFGASIQVLEAAIE